MGRRTPKQARSKDKVNKILAAARKLITEEGSSSLNTNRIAEEAGVGVGSIYEYFNSKESIAKALMESLADDEAEQVITTLTEATPLGVEATVRAVVELAVELYEYNHRLYHGLRSMAGIGRTVGHRPGEHAVLEMVRKWMAQHRDVLQIEDVERASFVSFHLVESLAFQMATDTTLVLPLPARVEEISKVVLRYLGIKEKAPS